MSSLCMRTATHFSSSRILALVTWRPRRWRLRLVVTKVKPSEEDVGVAEPFEEDVAEDIMPLD